MRLKQLSSNEVTNAASTSDQRAILPMNRLNRDRSTSNETVERTVSQERRNYSKSSKDSRNNDLERQYLNMLNGKEGFGVSPSRESPTRQTYQTMQSPDRKTIAGGDKLVQQNELKLVQAIEENKRLQQVLAKRSHERERLQFRYAKSQANFIEIMRELLRYREEFNLCHNLRSQLILTKGMCREVNRCTQLNLESI